MQNPILETSVGGLPEHAPVSSTTTADLIGAVAGTGLQVYQNIQEGRMLAELAGAEGAPSVLPEVEEPPIDPSMVPDYSEALSELKRRQMQHDQGALTDTGLAMERERIMRKWVRRHPNWGADFVRAANEAMDFGTAGGGVASATGRTSKSPMEEMLEQGDKLGVPRSLWETNKTGYFAEVYRQQEYQYALSRTQDDLAMLKAKQEAGVLNFQASALSGEALVPVNYTDDTGKFVGAVDKQLDEVLEQFSKDWVGSRAAILANGATPAEQKAQLRTVLSAHYAQMTQHVRAAAARMGVVDLPQEWIDANFPGVFVLKQVMNNPEVYGAVSPDFVEILQQEKAKAALRAGADVLVLAELATAYGSIGYNGPILSADGEDMRRIAAVRLLEGVARVRAGGEIGGAPPPPPGSDPVKEEAVATVALGVAYKAATGKNAADDTKTTFLDTYTATASDIVGSRNGFPSPSDARRKEFNRVLADPQSVDSLRLLTGDAARASEFAARRVILDDLNRNLPSSALSALVTGVDEIEWTRGRAPRFVGAGLTNAQRVAVEDRWPILLDALRKYAHARGTTDYAEVLPIFLGHIKGGN